MNSLKRSPRRWRSCAPRDTSMAPRPARNDDLVQLRRMTRDAVAEIDAPRQTGGNAVRAIGQAGQEAADPSDRDPEHERQREQIAGRHGYAEPTLDPLDRDEAADQPADDRLSCNQAARVCPLARKSRRVLHPREQTAADEAADRRGDDDPPTRSRIDDVSIAATLPAVPRKGERIGERLEHPMRVQRDRPDLDVDRKATRHVVNRRLTIVQFGLRT